VICSAVALDSGANENKSVPCRYCRCLCVGCFDVREVFANFQGVIPRFARAFSVDARRDFLLLFVCVPWQYTKNTNVIQVGNYIVGQEKALVRLLIAMLIGVEF